MVRLKKIRCQDCFVYEKNIPNSNGTLYNPTLKHRCKYFCVKCNSCEAGEGIWKLRIFKIYRGSYGGRVGPICHDCLSNALTGYHTGGGLVGNAIKKIKRVYKGYGKIFVKRNKKEVIKKKCQKKILKKKKSNSS